MLPKRQQGAYPVELMFLQEAGTGRKHQRMSALFGIGGLLEYRNFGIYQSDISWCSIIFVFERMYSTEIQQTYSP
jgi:hypothetical protein